MRKTSAALATLSLAVVALTGCTAAPASDGAACDRTGSTNGIADIAHITGDVGTAPEVELFTPVGVTESGFDDVLVGDGRALTSPTQKAIVEFGLFDGTTGEAVGTTAFDEESAQLVTIDYWTQRVPTFGAALECATEGSRIVVSLSPEEFGLGEDTPGVAVIDVVKVFPSRAEGTLQYNDAAGMPTVVRASDGRPGVIIPDSAAPIDLTVQTLIKGEGEKVEADDTVLVNYTGLTWDDKTVFDSSWDAGAVNFDLANLIEGFAQGLVGSTVGSQVLLVIPPELGYGEQGSGTIPADSTLVFVVDILGIDPPAAAQ